MYAIKSTGEEPSLNLQVIRKANIFADKKYTENMK